MKCGVDEGRVSAGKTAWSPNLPGKLDGVDEIVALAVELQRPTLGGKLGFGKANYKFVALHDGRSISSQYGMKNYIGFYYISLTDVVENERKSWFGATLTPV